MTTKAKKLPSTITICEPAHTAFDKATILIRQGYRFSEDAIVQVFQDGVASIVLSIGTPADPAVKAAEQAKKEALELEEYEFEKRVQVAAKAMLEEQARTEKQKQLEALRAEQLTALAAIEAQLVK